MSRTAFISYASEDEAIADRISAFLEASGTSCWIASRDVRPGADYAAEIIEAIETSAVMVLLLSGNANTSAFVKREVERAVSKGKPILSIRIEDVSPSKALELFISSAEWIDAWQPPIEQHLHRLAASIQSVQPSDAGTNRVSRPSPTVLPQNGSTSRTWSADGRPRSIPPSVFLLAGIAVAAILGWAAFGRSKPSSAVADGPPPITEISARPTETPGADTATRPQQSLPPPEQASANAGPCPATLSISRELPTPFTCTCTDQSGSTSAVWGTDVYTDDSSLCRAAVHAGVIQPKGGPITVMRIEGRPLYVGTSRNGVTSHEYGSYSNSISFKGAAPAQDGPTLCPSTASINRELPMPFTCRCTSESASTGGVWGTDVYTDDSSLCHAAVHAGVITPSGGTVTITRVEGRALYVGSTRNGVMSNDYGTYPASITFRR